MPDNEKKPRVNLPFRISQDAVDMIKQLAEHDNNRPPANYLEGLIKREHEKVFPKTKKRPSSNH